MTTELTIDLSTSRRCLILIGRGACARLPDVWRQRWKTAAIIGDRNVMALYGEGVAWNLDGVADRVVMADFPAGEVYKTRRTKQLLEDRLLSVGMDRGGCVVALGGGISLDVAGFVAAVRW